MSTETQKVVLHNVNASTEARYLPKNIGLGHLVEIGDAWKFSSAKSAERFLKASPEFKGYRMEVLP